MSCRDVHLLLLKNSAVYITCCIALQFWVAQPGHHAVMQLLQLLSFKQIQRFWAFSGPWWISCLNYTVILSQRNWKLLTPRQTYWSCCCLLVLVTSWISASCLSSTPVTISRGLFFPGNSRVYFHSCHMKPAWRKTPQETCGRIYMWQCYAAVS